MSLVQAILWVGDLGSKLCLREHLGLLLPSHQMFLFHERVVPFLRFLCHQFLSRQSPFHQGMSLQKADSN